MKKTTRYPEVTQLMLNANHQLRTTPLPQGEFVAVLTKRKLLTHVKPGFEMVLYDRYCKVVGSYTDINALPTTAPRLLGLIAASLKQRQFFTERGWTVDEATEKVSALQRTNSPESVMARRGCSYDEAVAIVTERMDRKTSTSIKLAGGADEYQRKKAAIARNVRDSVIANWAASKQLTGSPSELSSAYMQYLATTQYEQVAAGTLTRPPSNTTLQYYLNQGLTTDEAIVARNARQQTFSLEKCIAQYGEENGTERWQERQDKWQRTLDSKSPEELERIHIAKISNGAFVSNESAIFFKPLLDEFSSNYKIHCGETEYYINSGGKFWKYDFCIPALKLIVEYNGTHVHPREDFKDTWVHAFTKETKAERLLHDQLKHDAAVTKGFSVVYVWSDRDIKQQQDTVRSLIQQTILKEIK